MLAIPTAQRQAIIAAKFTDDLQSYTVYDTATKTLRAAICGVCDSIPQKAKCSRFVAISEAVKLFARGHLSHHELPELYPIALKNEYTLTQYPALKPFVLSPATYVNDQNEILICKTCHRELVENYAKAQRKEKSCQPVQSIANGYLIGSAPPQLNTLNDVELTLLSRVRIYCQSWIFFAGCHKHIQGWHTLFKNRPMENVANLTRIADSGMNSMVMVALCGPFTETQHALTMEKTAVRPELVIAAWEWLKQNNFRYADDVIPHIDKLPKPFYYEDNRSVIGKYIHTNRCKIIFHAY
jgi:hypothetical protein